MPYKFNTSKERSDIMKKIRSSGTKPEVSFGKILWRKGYRYKKNYKKLPGKPDFAFIKQQLAVFIDGEFWHGFNWEVKKMKITAHRDYWIPKIEKNIKRDQYYNKCLKKMGWKVMRFWEKEVEKNPKKCVKKIEMFLSNG